MTMNLEEDKDKKLESKGNNKEKDLSGKKKFRKVLNKNQNNSVFRNNYKNYQYDYEEDFYEPR